MTGPLDDLLAAYGCPPVLAPVPAEPTFTVVVRTQGRRPDSLREALESLATQHRPPAEVLLVVHDDRATADAVAAGLVDLPDRLPLRVDSVAGGGRARPLNRGLDLASGDYVCFLDDDDLAMPDWIEAFHAAVGTAPGAMVRAVTLTQDWTTDGSEQPRRPAGPIERPFPTSFDLLAHLSLNLTPLCGLAFPRARLDPLGLRFDEQLPVYEDWDLLLRAAMVIGVISVPEATSLYRRLDHGNADTAADVATWERAHAAVIERVARGPVLLPADASRRLAGAHFVTDGESRHEIELATARVEIDRLTRSPGHWARAFGSRLGGAIRHRIAAPRR
ncbi:MAG: glycosyltransferase family A protein [Acidimicrobiales bacterium]